MAADSPSESLYDIVSQFHGNPYRYLLAMLRDPDQMPSTVAKELGVAVETCYTWRYDLAGFKDAEKLVRGPNRDLRREYARLAMLEATPRAADAMVAVALDTKHRDGQRARERLLEATGILPKPGLDTPTPIQVTTHTYVLVSPGAAPVVVEQLIQQPRKAIEAPKPGST